MKSTKTDSVRNIDYFHILNSFQWNMCFVFPLLIKLFSNMPDTYYSNVSSKSVTLNPPMPDQMLQDYLNSSPSIKEVSWTPCPFVRGSFQIKWAYSMYSWIIHWLSHNANDLHTMNTDKWIELYTPPTLPALFFSTPQLHQPPISIQTSKVLRIYIK